MDKARLRADRESIKIDVRFAAEVHPPDRRGSSRSFLHQCKRRTVLSGPAAAPPRPRRLPPGYTCDLISAATRSPERTAESSVMLSTSVCSPAKWIRPSWTAS